MQRIPTPLDEVVLLAPRVFGDDRGYFLEIYQAERYESFGVPARFVQDNHSRSYRGVLRGLHYQLHYPQAKLVSVLRGETFDVAVDIRRGSPTFGAWYGVILNDENHRQLYVPEGFAHGFQVLSDIVDVSYKCSDYYHAEDTQRILWGDQEIGIDWPIEDPILSARDGNYATLRDQPQELLPIYEGSLPQYLK